MDKDLNRIIISTKFFDKITNIPVCPFCNNPTDEESKYSFVCDHCWTPFSYCKRCSSLDDNILVVMKLIKWGIDYTYDKPPPFKPIWSNNNCFRYVDNSTVFQYQCTRCDVIEKKNCD